MSEKIKHYPGIEGQESDSDLITASDKTDFLYNRATGQAMGRFLKALKEGKILGRKCFGCGRILVPPRMFCETCFKPTTRWVEVEDTGRIVTYSISHISTDATRAEEPIIIAVVELDGASPGMGFMHIVEEANPQQIHVGMRVKAVWKTVEERKGAITDIRYFKPII